MSTVEGLIIALLIAAAGAGSFVLWQEHSAQQEVAFRDEDDADEDL